MQYLHQVSCKLLSSTLNDSWRNLQTFNALLNKINKLRQYLPYQTYVHVQKIKNKKKYASFYYRSSRLTRYLMFNGSINYALYLQILHFYLVREMLLHVGSQNSIDHDHMRFPFFLIRCDLHAVLERMIWQ